jgi:hypothetical protein
MISNPTYKTDPKPQFSSIMDSDNWHGVEDRRLRKKIQDRLAQRARRKRLAQRKPDDSITPISNPSASVCTALFNNGLALGLSCTTCGISKSNPAPSTTPPSLHPTQLQLDVEHHGFIDRFPFPVFRNNFIYFTALIDTEEFLHDLFNLQSFWIVDGKPPWDHTAWRMGSEFRKRWGYLFYSDSDTTSII